MLYIGSGKSYTMMGTGSDDPSTKGLIPRICDALFARIKEVNKLTHLPFFTFLYYSLVTLKLLLK